MVVSDKVSLLNDIPAVCRLMRAELLRVVDLKDIFIFFIKKQEPDEEKKQQGA